MLLLGRVFFFGRARKYTYIYIYNSFHKPSIRIRFLTNNYHGMAFGEEMMLKRYRLEGLVNAKATSCHSSVLNHPPFTRIQGYTPNASHFLGNIRENGHISSIHVFFSGLGRCFIKFHHLLMRPAVLFAFLGQYM